MLQPSVWAELTAQMGDDLVPGGFMATINKHEPIVSGVAVAQHDCVTRLLAIPDRQKLDFAMHQSYPDSVRFRAGMSVRAVNRATQNKGICCP